MNPQTLPVTTFPALEDLDIARAAIQLCRRMVAPRLQKAFLRGASRVHPSVAIEGYMDDMEHPMLAFAEMVDASSGCPDLRTLELDDFSEYPNNIVACFLKVPSVTELYMSDAEEEPRLLITPIIVWWLTCRGQSGPLILPRLTSLTLVAGSENPYRCMEAAKAYHALVASRSSPMVVDGNELPCLEHYEFPDF